MTFANDLLKPAPRAENDERHLGGMIIPERGKSRLERLKMRLRGIWVLDRNFMFKP